MKYSEWFAMVDDVIRMLESDSNTISQIGKDITLKEQQDNEWHPTEWKAWARDMSAYNIPLYKRRIGMLAKMLEELSMVKVEVDEYIPFKPPNDVSH